MKRFLASPLVFFACYAVLFLFMDRNLNIYDEGIVALNAQRVLAGEMVHRDFYTPYGPGAYYAVAAAFSVFGQSLLVARLVGLTFHAGILALLFAIVRRETNFWLGLGAAITCALLFIANPLQYLYPTFPSAFFGLVGAWFFLAPGALCKRKSLFAAGFCCGLAAYFRYDAGFFTLVAFMLALAIVEISSSARRLALVAFDCLLLAFGAAVAFVPGAIAYLATSPITAFWADVVYNPLKYYALMRSLPFPRWHEVFADPAQFGVYLPIFVVLAGLPTITREVKRLRYDGMIAMPATLLLGVLSLVLYYKGIVRVSAIHMMLSIIPAIGLFAILLKGWWRAGLLSRFVAAFSVVLVGISTASAVAPQVKAAREMPERFVGGWLTERVGLLPKKPAFEDFCRAWPGMRFVIMTPDDARVARYLATKTDPHEKILVGVGRHDKIFVNAIALYFAADRMAGTHWAHYDPGIQTRADIQQEIINDLKQNDVRYVVRDMRFDGANEPNDSAKSSGVHVLDQFLQSHYRAVTRSGPIEVWLRDGSTAPSLRDKISACGMEKIRDIGHSDGQKALPSAGR